MKRESVEDAKNAAEVFLVRVALWIKRCKADPMVEISSSREGGGLRRASMDLTRALAEMRKP